MLTSQKIIELLEENASNFIQFKETPENWNVNVYLGLTNVAASLNSSYTNVHIVPSLFNSDQVSVSRQDILEGKVHCVVFALVFNHDNDKLLLDSLQTGLVQKIKWDMTDARLMRRICDLPRPFKIPELVLSSEESMNMCMNAIRGGFLNVDRLVLLNSPNVWIWHECGRMVSSPTMTLSHLEVRHGNIGMAIQQSFLSYFNHTWLRSFVLGSDIRMQKPNFHTNICDLLLMKQQILTLLRGRNANRPVSKIPVELIRMLSKFLY